MMNLLRSLLVTACCAASLLTATPALAAPAFEPSYYLPKQAEYPAGFVTLMVTPVSTIGDILLQGTIAVPHTGSSESITTFVTVLPGGQIGAQYMATRRAAITTQNGMAPFPSTVADESFVSARFEPVLDHWGFTVRDGAIVVESELTSYHDSLTAMQAGLLAKSILTGTLARMHAHPYGQ